MATVFVLIRKLLSFIVGTSDRKRDLTQIAFLRAQFNIIANTCNVIGLDMAAECLRHSLNNSPSDLSYGPNSSFSKSILDSTECAGIISTAINKARSANFNVVGYYYSGTATLNSTTDLHLSLNKVKYSVSLTRNSRGSRLWTVKIVFKDVYDFNKQDWANDMTNSTIVTIVNNYAAIAQKEGAIVPYDIEVDVKKSFYT